ncbi:uncharacterized protein LOC122401027 [Colletes gigas]|uniref:uncharacterized protein LOC122401027 n=1 Tax=Colletes gigas TaxID=935657 RepID=UPI001C9A7984|nr:uncharacterized protein LOC122401027 [Colletes gigas]
MCCEKAKVFLLLFVSLMCTFDFHVSAKIYTMIPSHNVSDLSRELTADSPSSTIISTTFNKHENSLFHSECKTNNEIRFGSQNLKGYRNKGVTSTFNDSNSRSKQNDTKYRGAIFTSSDSYLLKFLFQRLQKRSAIDKDDHAGNDMSRGKQKKAKALGFLLMNNDSTKNYEDIQDDYVAYEDDDYSKGVNGKKMNWEDYENEDGASVMELIVLDARHKKHRRTAYDDGNLY